MLKVGLTGGIAAGESVVGEMFVSLGAHLVRADRIAHSLMQPGEVREQLQAVRRVMPAMHKGGDDGPGAAA